LCRAQTVFTGSASASFNIAMICSSLTRLLFISFCSSFRSYPLKLDGDFFSFSALEVAEKEERTMARRGYSQEKIIYVLKQAEAGIKIGEVLRQLRRGIVSARPESFGYR
jgi:hypothetical protein